MDSISFLAIELLRFFYFFLVNFGKLVFLRVSKFQVYCHEVAQNVALRFVHVCMIYNELFSILHSGHLCFILVI